MFAGGATLDAARTIAGADLDALDGLVSKSLLVRRPQHESSTRLAMLETIRGFSAERFAHSAHEQAVRERHYRYFLAFAEEHGNDRAVMGRAGKDHVARLDLEIDNVHAALAWAVAGADARLALTMCKAIGPYWRTRSRYADAVRWIDAALDLPEAESVPALRAWVLCVKALSLRPLGRTSEQAPTLVEAEALARAQADPLALAHVLCECAVYHAIARHQDAADAFADEALGVATAAADAWAIATATQVQAMAAATLPELRARVDRAAALLDAVGNVEMLANVLSSSVYVALQLDAVDDAREFADRAMPIVRALDNPFLTLALCGNVGLVALLGGECRAAAHAFREELSLCRSLVVRPFAREGLMGLAAVNAHCGDPDRAARLAGASTAHRYGDPEGDVIAAKLDARFFQATRTRCGPAAWDAAARAGEALSFEDAIAYALDEQPAATAEAASTA